MKKVIFAALAAVCATFASCNKSETESIPATEGNQVCITFTHNDESGTRAFFDATAAAESWEKKINTMTIFVFEKQSGEPVVRRTMSAAELAAGKVIFALPWTAVDNGAVFYAIANYPLSETVKTQVAVKTLLEVAPEEYNGTFAEIADKAKRSNGFVMSAVKEVQLISGANIVALNLKRTVAKIAVRSTIAPDFEQRFLGAKIKVVNVELLKSNGQTTIIAPASPIGIFSGPTYSQVSKASGNDVYDNLFYCFENNVRPASEYVNLKVTAIYDHDGNFGTTGDQIEMYYDVPIVQSGGNGAIVRNGYYRVNLNIYGLSGHECTATISVADWESPVNQDVNLGK